MRKSGDKDYIISAAADPFADEHRSNAFLRGSLAIADTDHAHPGIAGNKMINL